MFTACENQAPFDTQTADDAPLILKPYNESGTGSFTYLLANPDTPLLDSVTVTPSNYTTVNWYLDGELIYTGFRIEMCFPVGKYALTIEAVTTAGKRTERTGSVTVNPYDNDPSSPYPAAGRHCVPNVEMTIDGQNLTKVKNVLFTRDIFGKNIAYAVAPSDKNDTQLKFTLPEGQDGDYFLRFEDNEGNIYGADHISIHNGAVVLAGYKEFVPGSEWTLTGVNLQDVASVKVDEVTVTTLAATASSVTLTAPDVEVGEHKLSMTNKDGSAVMFITDEGTVTEVTTIVSAETTIWEGSCVINWGDSKVELTAAMMADVPVGVTIYVYFNVPEAEYHALRITDDWWSHDLLPQVDGMADQPNPYTFVYTDEDKAAVEQTGKALVTGFGLEITKVSYK